MVSADKQEQSTSVSYKQKCKDLEARIDEINTYNESVTLAISKKKTAIKRLKIEYAILLERLEIKTLSKKTSLSTIAALYSTPPSASSADAEKVQEDQYSIPKSPSLPPLNMLELNSRLAPLIRLDDTLIAKQPPSVTGRSRGGRAPANSSNTHYTILPNSGAPVKRRGNYKHGKHTLAKKKERDPNFPKRPTNSYLIFCELEKEKLKEKLDKESPPGYMYDMSKALTEAWKSLNEEQKKPYYKLYEEDKRRYTEELRRYNEKKVAEAALAEAASSGVAEGKSSATTSPSATGANTVAKINSDGITKMTNGESGVHSKLEDIAEVKKESENADGSSKKEIMMIDVDADSDDGAEEDGKQQRVEDVAHCDEEDDVAHGDDEDDVAHGDNEEEEEDDDDDDGDGESSVLNTDMHDEEDDEEEPDSMLNTDGNDDDEEEEELPTENGVEDEDDEIDADLDDGLDDGEDDEDNEEIDVEGEDEEENEEDQDDNEEEEVHEEVHSSKKRSYIDVDDDEHESKKSAL